jgi:segregation and condensation protein A
MLTYRVKLPDFEGPLDLLLFFVKRDELNIYDIPIAKITRDFLEYIHLMQMLDLDIASEFIVMASTLMQIKARMLIPRQESEVEDEEEDPRAELVRRLIEYKKFKEISHKLGELEDEASRIYYRQFFKADRKDYVGEYETHEFLKDVSLFDLLTAFKMALEKVGQETAHEISIAPYTIEDEMNIILSRLSEVSNFRFNEIIQDYTERSRIIVSFLALLELARCGKVKLYQDKMFGEIFISRVNSDVKLADAI